MEASLGPVVGGSTRDLEDLRQRDIEVDEMHGNLVRYLSRLSLEPLTGSQSQRLSRYISAANYFENIADMVETNLVDAGRRRLSEALEISESTERMLAALHQEVVESTKKATHALATEDHEAAQEVVAAKSEVTQRAEEAEARLASRLAAEEPHRLAVFSVESDIVEAFRRIYYFAKRVAKLTAEVANNETKRVS